MQRISSFYVSKRFSLKYLKSFLILITLLINTINYTVIYAQKSSQQVSAKSEAVYVKYAIVKEEEKSFVLSSASPPVIRYIKPKFNISEHGNKEIVSELKTYTLEGFTYANDGSGIKNLTINNEIVKLDNNDYFEKLLILKPGKNYISFKSLSNMGETCFDTITIMYRKPESKNYILSIAIDDYTNWNDLEYPVKNAEELTNLLIRKYNFNGSERINIYNKDATSENIYSTLRKLISSLSESDNLLIYFAGHGYYAEDIQEGYWVPYNGRDDMPSDYISNSEIINFINAFRGKHVLLISDACFSGSFFASAERGSNAVSFDNFEKRPSRWAFSSGTIEKVSDNSPFCKYIVKYLEENDRDNLLFSELKDYVIASVGSNSNQMPMAGPLKNVNHQGGQFVFHLKPQEEY